MMDKDKISAMTANELLKFFITNASSLCTLLAKENKLLASGKLDEVQELFTKQNELSNVIIAIEQRISTSPESMQDADQKLRIQAKASFIKMQALTTEVAIQAQVGLRIAEGTREFLQRNMTEERMQALGYNKDGKMPSTELLERHMPSIAVMSRT